MSPQSADCISIIIAYFSFYCSTHDFKMPEMTVQDSETTKKCSKDFNLLFESIPRFNKDIKEGPIYSIRRASNIKYSVNGLWRVNTVNSPCDLGHWNF